MKIAFFDSGIGGLTVLKEAMELMPNEQYIYFADSKNAPYGTKSSQAIRTLVFDAVAFLAQQKLKALVLACNTATSVAVESLRQQYDFPIIGMEPAVKPALEFAVNKKILVCATDKTLEEESLRTLIEYLNGENKVEQLSLQKLVLFAENFEFQHPKVNRYLKDAFANINWAEFDSIVLGCTHFPYFKKQFRSLLPPQIRILDGNLGTVKHLKTRIRPTTATQPTPIEYYISGKKAATDCFDKYFDSMPNEKQKLI